jgi:hypothetical protein
MLLHTWQKPPVIPSEDSIGIVEGGESFLGFLPSKDLRKVVEEAVIFLNPSHSDFMASIVEALSWY